MTQKETALDRTTPVLHSVTRRQSRLSQGDRYRRRRRRHCKASDVMVEGTFDFGRHTAVSLEPRAILADYDKHTPAADPLYEQPGPAHDPDRVRAHPGRARAQCAGGRAGCRRIVRAEDSHLRRRDRGNSGSDRPGPAGQVHSRSAGILRLRYPCAREPHHRAHGSEQDGRDSSARDRCPLRGRRLFAVSPHQRLRGQSDPQHHWRPL